MQFIDQAMLCDLDLDCLLCYAARYCSTLSWYLYELEELEEREPDRTKNEVSRSSFKS